MNMMFFDLIKIAIIYHCRFICNAQKHKDTFRFNVLCSYFVNIHIVDKKFPVWEETLCWCEHVSVGDEGAGAHDIVQFIRGIVSEELFRCLITRWYQPLWIIVDYESFPWIFYWRILNISSKMDTVGWFAFIAVGRGYTSFPPLQSHIIIMICIPIKNNCKLLFRCNQHLYSWPYCSRSHRLQKTLEDHFRRPPRKTLEDHQGRSWEDLAKLPRKTLEYHLGRPPWKNSEDHLGTIWKTLKGLRRPVNCLEGVKIKI